MTRVLLRAAGGATLHLLLCLCLVGQQTITGESHLVLVNATVVDKQNRVRTDLKAADFQLREDGRTVTLKDVWLDEAPLSVIVLFDASSSMKRLDISRTALEVIASAAGPGDEYCLVIFRADQGSGCEFVSDADELPGLVADIRPRGDTAVIDSILYALKRIRAAKNSRRAIIVLSDGVDRVSRHTWNDVRRQALESTATLYAVSPYVVGEEDVAQGLTLERLVNDTGGSMLMARGPEQVRRVFPHRLTIRSQYVLSFVPAHPSLDRRLHKLGLKLSGHGQESLRVYSRRGYYCPAQHQ